MGGTSVLLDAGIVGGGPFPSDVSVASAVDCRRAGRGDDQHGDHGHRTDRGERQRPPPTQGPVTDRLLDQVVGHGRDRDHDREPGEQEQRAVESGAGRRDDEVDRPVPEVQAVRDLADPRDRLERQHAVQQPPVGLRHRGDDERGRERADEEAALVEQVGALGHARPRPDRVRRAEHGEHADHRSRVQIPDRAVQEQHDPERRAEQQRLRTRVGAVVDARRVGAGLVAGSPSTRPTRPSG